MQNVHWYGKSEPIREVRRTRARCLLIRRLRSGREYAVGWADLEGVERLEALETSLDAEVPALLAEEVLYQDCAALSR